MNDEVKDRIMGSLYGFFVGDALGVPFEFIKRSDLKEPIKDMIGYKVHNQPKGTWSDDSSMVIATIASIINNKDTFLSDELINYKDLMERFLKWVKNGEYTPHGNVFDIGINTREVLLKYDRNKNNVFVGSDDFNSNGNGSLMRILPISLCYSYLDRKIGNNIIKNVSSLTHANSISVVSCIIYSVFVANCMMGEKKDDAYKSTKTYINRLFEEDFKEYKDSFKSYFKRILKNDITLLNEKDIKSSGFVVDTLEAVLWCILNTNSYKEAVLKAVNLGDDTDTIGAITGGVAGVIYGIKDIPEEWLNSLQRKDYLDKMVNNYWDIFKLLSDKYNKNINETVDKSYKSGESRIIATKDSWNTIPMKSFIKVFLNMKISKEDMELLELGHIPDAMEDHWFMYVEKYEKTINYYRSWSNIQIFKAYYKEGKYIKIYKLLINKKVSRLSLLELIKEFKHLIQYEINSKKKNMRKDLSL